MKRIYSFVIVSLAFLVVFSCIKEDKSIPIGNVSFSDNVSVTFTESVIKCTPLGQMTVSSLSIEYADNDAFKDSRKQQMKKEGEQYVVKLEGLSIQTTYYYRYIAENKISEFQDRTGRSFKTRDYIVPEVVTCEATDISGTMATVKGEVTFACGKDIIEQGFLIGENEKDLKEFKTSLTEFSLIVNGLKYDTKYYYRAYAKTEIGTGMGEVNCFTTCRAISFYPLLVSNIKSTSVSLSGGVSDSGGIDITEQGFRYIENGTIDTITVMADSKIIISQLKPDKEYSVWCYAKTFEGEFEGKEKSFKTLDGRILINTLSPESVTKNSAKLKGVISSDGGSDITERGFCYSTSAEPTTDDRKIAVTGTVGGLEYVLRSLPQNTTYHVRAYAINGIGKFYGETVSFTTLYDSVQFGNLSCSNVTASSVSLTCSILSNGGSTVTKCGFCYSTSMDPTVDDGVFVVSGSSSSLAATIKNLNNGTKYYVRAFATNANSTFYSEELSFITVDGVIQFMTPAVSNIAAESVIVTSNVVSAGGGVISERGVCYGITKNPTTAGKITKTNGTTGEYKLTISGLKNKTVYYFRAYAKNESGTYYSQEISATTLDGVASLSTTATTDIMAQSATLNGIVSSDGGSNITERGFCYGTGINPTTSSAKIIIEGSTGAFSKNISGLKPATKYYVRAYAINGYGTHYGVQESFTTSDGVVVFSTMSATDITVSSVKVNAGISSDGKSSISKRGFCYGTSANPTTQGNTIVVDGTTGNYTATISGLKNNATYYVRPFAVNAVGTYYGNQITLKTLSGLADVSTSSVSDVKAQSATFNGNVTSANGASVTERGFCYATTENPTTSSHKLTVTGTTGTMTKTISSLEPNTKYYVRAFAKTSFGTTYGSQQIFTTLNGIVSFSDVKVSDITADSAIAGATIQDDGGSSITERGICFSLSSTPSISDSKVKSTETTASYSVTLSNLNRNTTYYYRAYAKNGIGTFYSKVMSFETQDGVASLGVLSISNIKQNTIDVLCSVNSDGGSSIIERGFCYGLSSSPTTSSYKKIVTGAIGDMSATLSGLNSDADYYIRGYVETNYETTYSNEVKVHTIAGLASLSSTEVDEIGPTSADLHAKLISQGGSTVIDMGFCLSISMQPTISDIKLSVPVKNGDFSCVVTDLNQYTTYFCRPYATTEYGTNYGPLIDFTTTFNPIQFGNVSISTDPTSALISCELNDIGGLPILEEGIIYSLNRVPTIDDSKINTMLFPMSRTFGVAELNQGTTYYVRQYVRNRAGIFYGDVYSFTTLSAPTAVVPGLFSVSADEQAYFSIGNLILENNEWRFSTNQYDVLRYYPYSKDSVSTDTRARDLFDPDDDWESTRKIKNGGEDMSVWHVLHDWSYLLFGRANASKLRYWVSVANTNGLLLLPDNWVTPRGISLPLTEYENISEANWVIYENNGAVFIPFVEKVMQWWGSMGKCYNINQSWGAWGSYGKQGYYSVGSETIAQGYGKLCSVLDLYALQRESIFCDNRPSGSMNESNKTYIRAIRLVQTYKK